MSSQPPKLQGTPHKMPLAMPHRIYSIMSTNPLLLVLLPSIYMLGATFSLLQFSVLLTTISKGVSEIKRLSSTYAILKHALPFLTSSKELLNKIFGDGQKFVPQPTHVILVALLLAFIVHIERLRK